MKELVEVVARRVECGRRLLAGIDSVVNPASLVGQAAAERSVIGHPLLVVPQFGMDPVGMGFDCPDAGFEIVGSHSLNWPITIQHRVSHFTF